MGRLERVIVVGALLTVGVLVAMLVWNGLERREAREAAPEVTEWSDPGAVPLAMQDTETLPPGGRSVTRKEAEDGAGQGTGRDPAPAEWVGTAVAVEPVEAGMPVEASVEAVGPSEPPPPVPQGPRRYRVRPGDTLSGIAKAELGSALRWRDIQRLNPDLEPERLQAGVEIVLPARQPTTQVEGGQPAEAAGGSAKEQGRTYTVRPGDNLWKLAYRFYGGPNGVDRILAANPDQLESKNQVLRIGMTLRIPR